MASVHSARSSTIPAHVPPSEGHSRRSSTQTPKRAISASHQSHSSQLSSSDSSTSKGKPQSRRPSESYVPAPKSPSSPGGSPRDPESISTTQSGMSLLEAPIAIRPFEEPVDNYRTSIGQLSFQPSVSTRPPTLPPKDEDPPAWLNILDRTPRTSQTISSYGQVIEPYEQVVVPEELSSPEVLYTGESTPTFDMEAIRQTISDMDSPEVHPPTATPTSPNQSHRTPSHHSSSHRSASHRSDSHHSASHHSACHHSGSHHTPSNQSSPRKSTSSSKHTARQSSTASSSAPRSPIESPVILPEPRSPPKQTSILPAPPRTMDSIRDQVASSTSHRIVRKSEVVDGTRIGVVLTLSKSEDGKFLHSVAQHLASHPQLANSEYLFAVLTSPSSYSPSPPRNTLGELAVTGEPASKRSTSMRESLRPGASSLLLFSSNPLLLRRAVMLACAKLLSRVEEREATSTRWLGLVHSHPGAVDTFSAASANDEDVLWDVVRRAAVTQSMAPRNPYNPPPGALSIDDILAKARAKLERVPPEQAYTLLRATTNEEDPPALLIDIRPAAQRAVHGGIHGSLLIERNVLEWRLDPRSAARLAIADRYDLRAIVLCQEGYTSSLAAAALQEVGLWNATDVIGGIEAWKRAGLPMELEVEDVGYSEDGRSEGGRSRGGSSLISGTNMGDGVGKDGW